MRERETGGGEKEGLRIPEPVNGQGSSCAAPEVLQTKGWPLREQVQKAY